MKQVEASVDNCFTAAADIDENTFAFINSHQTLNDETRDKHKSEAHKWMQKRFSAMKSDMRILKCKYSTNNAMPCHEGDSQ